MEPLEPFNHFPCTSSMASSLQCYPLNLANQVQEKMMMTHGVAPGIDLGPMLFANPFGLGEVKLQQQQQQQQVGLLENLGMGNDEGNTSGGVSAKEKKVGMKGKKPSRPRFAFRTRTDNDILDDGYRWRKYGQKAVKNSAYPRSYYRCTHHSCEVKKQVQRLSKDTSIVVTTYEGVHNHPCEKLMEALAPLIKQIQLLSQF